MREKLLIDVTDRDRVLGAVKGHQAHYVVAVGDHVQAMEKLAGDLGVSTIRLESASQRLDPADNP